MNTSDKIAIISLVINSILALLTLFYVILTRGLLNGMRSQMRGMLHIEILHKSSALFLVVKNIGQSDIENIEIDINSSIKIENGELSDLFKDTPFIVESMTPSKENRYFLGYVKFQLPENQNKNIQIATKYTSNCIPTIKTFKYRTNEISNYKEEFSEIANALNQIASKLNQPVRNFGFASERFCPFCCEKIHKSAKKCKHCLSVIEEGK